MKRLALLSFLLIGCGLEQAAPECTEDTWLIEFDKLVAAPYEIVACPAGMPLSHADSGCVRCTYIDQCGSLLDIAGCSPAPGVFCVDPAGSCPAGFEIPQDMTVRAMEAGR